MTMGKMLKIHKQIEADNLRKLAEWKSRQKKEG